jgi:hypothetical protein
MDTSPYFDAALYIVSDCANVTASCLDGDDSGNPETINYTSPGGGTYYIIADGYTTGNGPYTLDVTITGDACGNTICDGSETTCSCPIDCGTSCGDGCCNGTETVVSCAVDCICAMPVTIGTFNSNDDGWSAAGNWLWDSLSYMSFDDFPTTLSYSMTLASYASDLSDCTSVYVNYQVMLNDYVNWDPETYGGEQLIVQCSGDGSTAYNLATYSDGDDFTDLSFGWTSYSNTLPAACLTATSYIWFLATGEDTYNINEWGVDSISYSSS